MSTDRIVAGLVVATIVALTLATGPVGPLDVETESDSGGLDDPGSGTATVEILSEPDAVTMEASDDGQDLFYLSVPATTVRTSNVSGNPILSYTIALKGSGLSTDSLEFLGELDEGTLELTIDRRTYQSYEVENVTAAELGVTFRGEETETLLEKTVPVDRS